VVPLNKLIAPLLFITTLSVFFAFLSFTKFGATFPAAVPDLFNDTEMLLALFILHIYNGTLNNQAGIFSPFKYVAPDTKLISSPIDKSFILEMVSGYTGFCTSYPKASYNAVQLNGPNSPSASKPCSN